MPEYYHLKELNYNASNNLGSIFSHSASSKTEHGYKLLVGMLEYDPDKRFSAQTCLNDPFFTDEPKPGLNSFVSPNSDRKYFEYPHRRVHCFDLVGHGKAEKIIFVYHLIEIVFMICSFSFSGHSQFFGAYCQPSVDLR